MTNPSRLRRSGLSGSVIVSLGGPVGALRAMPGRRGAGASPHARGLAGLAGPVRSAVAEWPGGRDQISTDRNI